jgi:hypothetical protein
VPQGTSGHLLLKSDSWLFIMLTISGWEEHLKDIFPKVRVVATLCLHIRLHSLLFGSSSTQTSHSRNSRSLRPPPSTAQLYEGPPEPPTPPNPTSVGVLDLTLKT